LLWYDQSIIVVWPDKGKKCEWLSNGEFYLLEKQFHVWGKSILVIEKIEKYRIANIKDYKPKKKIWIRYASLWTRRPEIGPRSINLESSTTNFILIHSFSK